MAKKIIVQKSIRRITTIYENGVPIRKIEEQYRLSLTQTPDLKPAPDPQTAGIDKS
jgi:hypothetical protein